MASCSLCQWCNQVPITVQYCSKHNICNKCQIKRRTCQSPCPCCWYDNGTNFLNSYHFCAGKMIGFSWVFEIHWIFQYVLNKFRSMIKIVFVLIDINVVHHVQPMDVFYVD